MAVKLNLTRHIWVEPLSGCASTWPDANEWHRSHIVKLYGI